MILERTVLVLGAGASAPYGFPLGMELAKQVYKGLDQGDAAPIAVMCSHAGVSADVIKHFRKRFLLSASWSLDQFASNDPDFARFAKIAMTCALAQLERVPFLAPPFQNSTIQEHDWYEYLFHHLLPPDGPEKFTKNQVRVLTFNFDRSFEYRLWLTLTANYGDERATQLAKHIPILHVHGDLGAPHWLDPHAPLARPYHPLSITADNVLPIAERLRLVLDEVERDAGKQIGEWLEWAEQICFIGLAYHPLNIQRLRVATPGHKHIWGTRFRLEDGEVRYVTNQYSGIKLTSKEADALQFLKVTGVANEW